MVDWISSPACLTNLGLLLMHILLILDIGLRVFDFLRHPDTLGDKCGPRLAEVQPRVVEDLRGPWLRFEEVLNVKFRLQ